MRRSRRTRSGRDDLDIEITKAPDEEHPEGAVEEMVLQGKRVVVHYQHLPEKDRTIVQGIPCTTALRTVIDIAPDLSHDHLARVVTDCVRRGLFTVDEALGRVTEPDVVGRVGARLLRAELLRRR